MAQLNYTDVMNNTETSNSSQVSFFSIKNGEEAVVRFMIDCPEDMEILSFHSVHYGDKDRKISCLKPSMNAPIDTCPFCAHGSNVAPARFIKSASDVNTKVFVKMLRYVLDDNNNVISVPQVWERPTSFVKDIIGKLSEYGPLSDCVFKIRRVGASTDTKYTIDFGIPAKYPDSVYEKDFSALKDYHALGTVVMNMSYEDAMQFVCPSVAVPNAIPNATVNVETHSVSVAQATPIDVPFDVNDAPQAPIQTASQTPTITNPFRNPVVSNSSTTGWAKPQRL